MAITTANPAAAASHREPDSLHLREKMMGKETKQQHRREHGSLLAAPEKRLLVWMAERLPRWVNSDHLSALGLSAMLVAGLAFWAASWNTLFLLVVVAALAVNWFGDSLDGTVARVRNQQRPRYGFYVDHVIDILGTFFLFAGAALSDFMSASVALAFMVAYMMVSAESYLATHSRGVFKMSFMRIGPTELRIILAIGVLYLFQKPLVGLGGDARYLLFDVGGVVATAGLAVTFIISAARNTVALYRAEPTPPRQEASPSGQQANPVVRKRARRQQPRIQVNPQPMLVSGQWLQGPRRTEPVQWRRSSD
jgi:phosphatidylglycerophosphate synthase